LMAGSGKRHLEARLRQECVEQAATLRSRINEQNALAVHGRRAPVRLVPFRPDPFTPATEAWPRLQSCWQGLSSSASGVAARLSARRHRVTLVARLPTAPHPPIALT